MSSYYQHHLFFCCNQRPPGARTCCADKQAEAARDRAKQWIKKLDLAAPGKARVNQAGCLERCEEGPCLVIYPEAVWYRYQSIADIDEIIQQHVVNGQVVDRLRLPDA